MRVPPIFALAIFAASCSAPLPFAEANALMKRQIAADIILKIEPGSERRYARQDGSYSVCGVATLDQHGSGGGRRQRFVITVRNGLGIALFDGDQEAEQSQAFEATWRNKCRDDPIS